MTLLHYATARQAVAGVSGRGVSALSVISLRRNGISTTSAIPTARLPTPSSANSFAYPALVAIAVVPVGSGIIPEKSPANSDARPVTSIQLPIITPWYCFGASLPCCDKRQEVDRIIHLSKSADA